MCEHRKLLPAWMSAHTEGKVLLFNLKTLRNKNKFQMLNLQNKFQMIKLFSLSFFIITDKYQEQSAILPMSEPGCPKNRNRRKDPSIGKS